MGGKQRRANQDNYWVRREVPGPTYRMATSDQRQEGDPVRQLALREPSGYEHPERLGSDVVEPGGPRILPVSQDVPQGQKMSRNTESERAAAELGALHHALGFRDRRFGYRPTDNVAELDGPQEPYPAALAPAELPLETFKRGW
jgi:hypothetical protein